MIELRDYQLYLMQRVGDVLADAGARIMMQLPTGGGKTHIAGELLSEWLKDGRKAVWLTHRKELAVQTEGMLRQANVPATANIRWTPRTDAPMIANGVVILMAQTVSRRNSKAAVWGDYNSRDLMIIDEAHHATARGWARAMKQWPGPVIGMTATPWRLSEREGFDHLFDELYCGPQVSDLQSGGWLCPASVVLPAEQEQVQGGQIDYTGDYSESGIELANDKRDVWTAGALRFWQKHGESRPTLVYAVSVRHARNLAAVFSEAGIPAGLLLGDTPAEERARPLQEFQNGTVKVLVNVVVATEGFDLPDASCVVLTRPTTSLSLYLQMVGRGLRPKPDGGDCIVLDLAGNSLRHGLPEEDREWSLLPRGAPTAGDGEPWVVRCPECEGVSPAASHACSRCGAPFGESCNRCGAWRVWDRWSRKTGCGEDHDLVCDLCHYDAHVHARLPVTEELKELSMLRDGDELSPTRDPFLKDFLEEERRRFTSADEGCKEELRLFIDVRESELADVEGMWDRYEQHLQSLPHEQHPENDARKAIAFVDWKNGQESELAGWKEELAGLENRPIEGQLIFRQARERLLRLLESEGKEAGLLPRATLREESFGTTVEEPSQPRPTKAVRIPQREYIRPILESLVELGGSAKRSQVEEMVFQKMKSELTEQDLGYSPSERRPRWRVRAGFCRQSLVDKHRFLRSDSPHGVWEITQLGRRYLEGLK